MTLRKYVIRLIASLLVFTLSATLLAGMFATPVKAVTTYDTRHMVICYWDTDKNAKLMEQAVKDDYWNRQEDAEQHKWVKFTGDSDGDADSLNSALTDIYNNYYGGSNKEDFVEQTAIVFWGGETALDDDILTWVGNKSNKNQFSGGKHGGDTLSAEAADWGTDASYTEGDIKPDDETGKEDNAAARNSHRMGMYLFGWDYTVETVNAAAANDAVPSDFTAGDGSTHTTGTAPSEAMQDGVSYTFEEDDTKASYEWSDADGDHTEEYTTYHPVYHWAGYKSEMKHYDGVFERREDDYKSIPTFTCTLGIVNKSKGDGKTYTLSSSLPGRTENGSYTSKIDVTGSVASNADVETWNATMPTYTNGATGNIDIYQYIIDKNPYYRGAFKNTTGGRRPGGGTTITSWGDYAFYDDPTLCWIFRTIWNTVINFTHKEEEITPVDTSYYSVSSSLTAYFTAMLSGSIEGQPRKLPEAAQGAGNAGDFIGYGDKKDPYNFKSYILEDDTKTSTVVNYEGLIGLDDSNKNDTYAYARYGRLLNDMGFDETASTGIVSPRLVPGALMEGVYIISSGVNFVFDKVIDLMKATNPFSLFAVNYDDEQLWEDTTITSDPDGLNGGASTSTTTKDGGAHSYSGETIADKSPDLRDWIANVYNIFRNFGLLTVIPFLLVLAIASYLFNKAQGESLAKKLGIWFFRILFIVGGIPLLGGLYSSVINYMDFAYDLTQAPSSEIVACTFVDFQSWVKYNRLGPVSGTLFVSEAKGPAGQATDETMARLRLSATKVNQATGAISGVDMSHMSSSGGLSSVFSFYNSSFDTVESTALSNTATMAKMSDMLTTWMTGGKYSASSWESDSLATFMTTHKDDVGRQVLEEELKAASTPAEKEALQKLNEGTLYEMFNAVSTTESWTSRGSDGNLKIIQNSDEDEYSWDDFNMFGNGTLTASIASPSKPDESEITYTNGSPSMCTSGVDANKAGQCLSSKTGLSTIAMYNYLSSAFANDNVTIFTNMNAINNATSESHYSVNLVGTGSLRILYYLSAFLVMAVISFLGLYFAVGIFVRNLVNGVKLIVSVPGAMLGVMKSIIQVVLIVVTMIAEIIAVFTVYHICSQALMLVLTMSERFLTDDLNIHATAIGGWVSDAFGGYVAGSELLTGTLMLAAACVITFAVGIITFAKRKQIIATSCAIEKLLLVKFTLYSKMCDTISLDEDIVVPRRDICDLIQEVFIYA